MSLPLIELEHVVKKCLVLDRKEFEAMKTELNSNKMNSLAKTEVDSEKSLLNSRGNSGNHGVNVNKGYNKTIVKNQSLKWNITEPNQS